MDRTIFIESFKKLGANIFKDTGTSGGGCISSGSSYLTDTIHGEVFVKTNTKPNAKNMFEGEKCGLEAILQTHTVICPKPILIVEYGSTIALVMQNLKMRSITGKLQGLLGEQLANMHLHNKRVMDKHHRDEGRVHKPEHGSGDSNLNNPVTKFGFPVPTSCGYLSQDNSWVEDWPTFYIRQKLQKQIDMLSESEKESVREVNELWSVCSQKIQDILSRTEEITPALLHGDLWSGNIASVDNQPMIFDPASFYGHSEYDLGIAQMFGGLSSSFYDGYFKINPRKEGFKERVDIYELFHHLNHWNHFGSGYKGSTIKLMKSISKFK